MHTERGRQMGETQTDGSTQTDTQTQVRTQTHVNFKEHTVTKTSTEYIDKLIILIINGIC